MVEHLRELLSLLVRFERVEVRPFHPSDTLTQVEAAVAAGRVPPKAAGIVEWLHRRSAGIPRGLCELLEGLASGRYDPDKAFDLKLLDLDRRIHQAFPDTGASSGRGSQRFGMTGKSVSGESLTMSRRPKCVCWTGTETVPAADSEPRPSCRPDCATQIALAPHPGAQLPASRPGRRHPG
jgi:hypothetical protein